MSFDVALLAVIVGGIGLSAAYVRAEYLSWRANGAAERRRESVLRDLHAARLSGQDNPQLLPSVLELQGFGEGEAANPDSANELYAARRASTRSTSGRKHPLEEQRKRVRQRAAP
jgi:hypothetical protein